MKVHDDIPTHITNPHVITWIRNDPTCADCGVGYGVEHRDGCDWARCLATGSQRLSCEYHDDFDDQADHDCGRDIHTELDQANLDAVLLGLYTTIENTSQPVTADHPKAIPNASRLLLVADWNPTTCHWEARQ